ncbi:MAG: 30S ribosomal protein S21 2 [Gammaproteobacteria bacterium]|nr:MAG: 30S ribosomal protein S21 2 [Gammaproteobacteria bacterium]
MPSIKIKETESFDVGLRKFRRACERAGIITEIRKREFMKSQQRKEKKSCCCSERNYKRVMKDSFAK